MPFTNKFHLLNLDYAICTQHVAHAAKSGLSQLDALNLPLTSDAVVVKRYVSRNYWFSSHLWKFRRMVFR